VTKRCPRSICGNLRTRAAKTARSAQSRSGFGLALRSTATSWRNTSSSMSLDAEERPSNTSRFSSRTKTKVEQTQRHGARSCLPAKHTNLPRQRRGPTSGTPQNCGDGPRRGWRRIGTVCSTSPSTDATDPNRSPMPGVLKCAAHGGADVTDLVNRFAYPLGPIPLAVRGLRPCSRGPARRARGLTTPHVRRIVRCGGGVLELGQHGSRYGRV
jgi:hypothetical protein